MIYSGCVVDLESGLRANLSAEVKYPLTLSWYDFEYTYYVEFKFDPNLVKEGSEYLP